MAKSEASPDGVKSAADIDAILNRHRLNLAKNRKLIEGWLPLSKQEREQQDLNTEPETATVDTLLRSELAGLGADLRQGSRLGANGLPSGGGGELEKLRKQMLGKNASLKTSTSQASNSRANGPIALKLSADSNKRSRNDGTVASDSDDEGRAASFTSKRSKKERRKGGVKQPPNYAEQVTDSKPAAKSVMEIDPDKKRAASDLVRHSPDSDDDTHDSSKHTSSILDQVIAERQKKKKKKKNRKKLKAKSQESENL